MAPVHIRHGPPPTRSGDLRAIRTSPVACQVALAALKEVARTDGNVFAVLMEAVRACTLQQITEAFFEVGGQYRRNV